MTCVPAFGKPSNEEHCWHRWRAKTIDGRLPPSLIHLPIAITGECEIDEYHSLAVRELQRGHGVGCHRERQWPNISVSRR
jgi:hypothetical protein